MGKIRKEVPSSSSFLMGVGVANRRGNDNWNEKSGWFCGHYHRNGQLDKKTMILYDRIVKIV